MTKARLTSGRLLRRVVICSWCTFSYEVLRFELDGSLVETVELSGTGLVLYAPSPGQSIEIEAEHGEHELTVTDTSAGNADTLTFRHPPDMCVGAGLVTDTYIHVYIDEDEVSIRPPSALPILRL